MAANPRIDDLRKRLQKEPGSRLFAQLAEELRKEGELEEAIRVCREGLSKNPNYPSARMTLGRALFDNGDLPGARGELEAVLKGAPDNILASRMLGECLEGLGDPAGALARYRLTLQMSPGDKQVQARLDALEGKGAEAGPPGGGAVAAAVASRQPERAAPATAAVPPPTPARAAEPAGAASASGAAAQAFSSGRPGVPPPAAAVSLPEPVDREAAAVVPSAPPTRPPGVVIPFAVPAPAEGGAAARPPEAPEAGPVERPEPPPIPLVAVEEDFELERPGEAPTAPAAAAARTAPVAARVVERVDEYEFEDEGPATLFGMKVPAMAAAQPPPAAPTIEPLEDLEYDFERNPLPKAAPATAQEEASTVPVVPGVIFEAPGTAARGPSAEPGADAVPPLASPTLAELYFNQGSTDRAVAVYRQLLAAEPRNLRWQARLAEIEALDRQLRGAEAAVTSRAARREVLRRTVARLEAFRAVVRREYRA